MSFFAVPRISIAFVTLCWGASGQTPANESKGMPPRAAPTDYQAQGKAGAVTIAADSTGHSVTTPEGTFTTEDYIAVETAFFGTPNAHATISADDFSLRINGKKAPLPSQGYLLILKSLKDPEWIPPDVGQHEPKSKGGITGGGDSGGGAGGDPPPLPPKMPLELQRVMAQKVQRSVLPEGDRALPVAGFLFFAYRGKTEAIKSMELIYSGSAGKATIALQP
jgi:hypothetical protein